jgi:hypothetical protein
MDRRTIESSIWLMLLVSIMTGCGTTREKLATEQLLLSDAVDVAVSRIDFSPLRGEKVFLDDTYVKQIKGSGFVNADYIVSSIRQQMLAAGCLIQETRDQADYVAEARVGALGSDAHEFNFGLAGSQGISQAASLVSGGIPLPVLPEISLARRTDDSAATKVAVFAYHRESREPVWQSGLSVARSRANSRWVLGAGPFQSGSIYNGTQFEPLQTSPLSKRRKSDPEVPHLDAGYRDMAVWSPKLREKLKRRYSDPDSDRELVANRPDRETDGDGAEEPASESALEVSPAAAADAPNE